MLCNRTCATCVRKYVVKGPACVYVKVRHTYLLSKGVPVIGVAQYVVEMLF